MSEEAYYLVLFMNPLKACPDTIVKQEAAAWLGEWLDKHPGERLLEKIKADLIQTASSGKDPV